MCVWQWNTRREGATSMIWRSLEFPGAPIVPVYRVMAVLLVERGVGSECGWVEEWQDLIKESNHRYQIRYQQPQSLFPYPVPTRSQAMSSWLFRHRARRRVACVVHAHHAPFSR